MSLGLLPHFVNTSALRYFYEVARYGSFQLAEEKIFIAASAIRRQIQLLEDELDTQLFVRERNGLRLTAAGETLLYRVRRAMKELNVARSEISVLQGERTGNVRLGVNETIAREFLPGFLKQLNRKYPSITFEIVVANTNALARIVMRGDVDIIVGYAMQAQSGLQEVLSYRLHTCVTVHRDHPLAARASVRVADLVDQTFIMPSRDSLTSQIMKQVFARVAIKPMFNISTDSFELIGVLVAQGLGIGCQVSLFTGPDPNRPELVYVPIRDVKDQHAVLACCIAQEGLPNMATSLCLEALRTELDSWCTQALAKVWRGAEAEVASAAAISTLS
ncbi:LysR family transcriptional regulator [Hydrogenophaga sp.]|uniref:LysR family transcriptional regulator n=1 Tax=Hydrogenophaga sp. TaxID=1904254 RepID=UPI0027209ED2|nr:LysR family transcriptional regulator [Hydrogenophaga sp.]MDO9434199.1 LysR family transcriptional regulator [Hydrogenophaga sp.]